LLLAVEPTSGDDPAVPWPAAVDSSSACAPAADRTVRSVRG
jgi:hypothetical protein